PLALRQRERRRLAGGAEHVEPVAAVVEQEPRKLRGARDVGLAVRFDRGGDRGDHAAQCGLRHSNLLPGQPLTLNAASAAMLTSSESVAARPTICTGRSSPTSSGPITVAPPSSCSILVEIAAEWNAGMISTLAGPDSRQNGYAAIRSGLSATSAAISPSYSKSTRRWSSSRTAPCTWTVRSPGGWPKVENASSASRGSY